MTPNQVRLLLNVSNGATANSTDAQLRDRSTHTGTQDVSTITDFHEEVRDEVGNVLVSGDGIDIEVDDVNDVITIHATPMPFIFPLVIGDETTPITTGTGKFVFHMPMRMTLVSVKASLAIAQASGSDLTVDVTVDSSSIFSNLIVFDNGVTSTADSITPPSLATLLIEENSLISVDVTQVGTAGAAGLKVFLVGYFEPGSPF